MSGDVGRCRNFLPLSDIVQTLDLPLSWSMKHYIDSRDLENAYRVACLGVTDADWRFLGLESLQAQFWNVALGFFSRLKDVCYLDLINQVEKEFEAVQDKLPLLATICAYQGRFEEAAELYCEGGEIHKAMEMFADLHMFDEAKAIAGKTHVADSRSQAKVQEIIQKQAEWTKEKNDHATAADMYLIAGQPEKALAFVAEHGPPSKLIEVARRLKRSDTRELSLCATLMKLHGLRTHALETYTKLGDFRSVLLLHIDMQQWDDAFAMKNLHPDLDINVYSPYAEWLVSQDQYEKARFAYKQAGQPESMSLLKKLLNNAIVPMQLYSFRLAGCYKAARSAYGRLQGLRVPASWMEKLDVAALAVRARAAVSDESSPRLECPCCFCCGSPLPVVVSPCSKDICSFCSQPIIRSFVSFEQLPIVEFFLEDGISQETARKLLKSMRCGCNNSKSLEGSNKHNMKSNDGHWRTMLQSNSSVSTSKPKPPGPLRASETTLTSLQTRQVIVQECSQLRQSRYFYMIDPLFAVCQCDCCNRFFEQEEWDAAVL